MLYGFPVLARPLGVTYSGLFNLLKIFIFALHGNGYPLRATGSFDLIPVPPVSSGVLNIVEKNELVNARNDIEIPFPGDITRLNNSRSFVFNEFNGHSFGVRIIIEIQILCPGFLMFHVISQYAIICFDS